MHPETPTLQGRHIRLEPLALHHADALVAAATGDPILYRWSPVPQAKPAATAYIETALAWRDAGTAVSFAVVLAENARTENGHADSNQVIGSTRFFNLERWAWPETHPEHNRRPVDACEIGYTWYSPTAIRTAANTEAKLLLLTHAFETWQVLRVCLHTDVRNTRSRAAIERIGGKLEGILRSHRLAADLIPRDSARYSILPAEWPEVKRRLQERPERP